MIIEHYPISYDNIQLSIMPRPRSGDWLEDEFCSFTNLKYKILISLLTYDEEAELNLENESQIANESGITFYSYPIVDRSVPADRDHFIRTIHYFASLLKDGTRIGIHCRMGIGRSGLFCAALLMSFGESYENAVAVVSEARGISILDDDSQIEFLKSLFFESFR